MEKAIFALLYSVLPYITTALASVIAIVLHEYTKASISTKLGDATPSKNGDLTLSPKKHVDTLGLIFLVFFKAGWSNPVQTSPVYYKNRKQGVLITYIFPILLNLLIGFIVAGLIKFVKIDELLLNFVINNPSASPFMGELALFFGLFVQNFIRNIAFMNVHFALLSLIPIFPFDGARILSAFLSPSQTVKLHQYQSFLQLLLLVGVWTSFLGRIFIPATRAVLSLIGVVL